MTQKVLSYDLGGTKVAVGVVSSQGQILDEIRVPALFEEGKEAVLQQLVDLGRQLLSNHSEIKNIGIASAGPLDPKKGELLDPTNFASSKGNWGNVPITKILKQSLKRPAYLENDAAASILAEHWVGAAKKIKNAMSLTLGTGLGTGIICNGILVRSGRNLHPEAGHFILQFNDTTALCGCGNYGCAEAYLSGRNFEKRMRIRLGKPTLSAKDIADLARSGDLQALKAFDEYSEIMAIAIYNYVRAYSPEIVVFTGSFAATSDLFLEKTQMHLEPLLARNRQGIDLLPQLALSPLQNEAGIIGGAYIGFRGLKATWIAA